MKSYTRVIPAGETRKVDVNHGNFIRLKEVSDVGAPVVVKAIGKNGQELLNDEMLQGNRVTFVDEIAKVEITNEGIASLTVIVTIGVGIFQDDRISGVVSVIDNQFEQTAGGVAFQAGVIVNAVAAQYGHLQLWNPAGSGKNITVNKLMMHAVATATACAVARHSTALTTLAGPPGNCLLGGAASAAEGRSQLSAAGLIVDQFGVFSLPADQSIPVDLNNPIIIPPNDGLLIWCATVNIKIGATLFYVEEAA